MTDTGLYFEDLITLRNRARADDLRNRSIHDEECDMFRARAIEIGDRNRAELDALQETSNRWYAERPR